MKYMGLACLAVSSSFCWSPPRYQLLTSTNHQQSIAYVFAHGLGADHTQANKLFKPYYEKSILCGPVGIFDFPDAKSKQGEFYKEYVNLGQARDIERLSYACNRTLELTNCSGIVLVGISRGSATILKCTAKNNNTLPIKAIIAEASFDSLTNVVKHLLKRFHISWIPFAKKIGIKIADVHFRELDVHGLFPVDIVAKIDRNIPILLVHSRKDRVIPLVSSHILYTALRAAGHEHVYLLELPSGDHGKLMVSNESTYQNVVHAFYKKYNLPYNAECALQGEALFARCQPSIQEIKKRI